MKKVLCIALLALTILSIPSCKSCKKNKAVATNETKENTYTNLIVSFYSPGSGIDFETSNKFLAFLDSYIPKVSYDIIHWGREGETDYCIDLSGLNSEDQKVFKEKARELVSVSDRVNISENEKCRAVMAED